MEMNRRIAVLALGSAVAVMAGAAYADTTQPLNRACSKAPSIRGYQIAKVISVTPSGEAMLDSGSDKGLKDGLSCHVVDCKGERPWRAKNAVKLKDVSSNSSKATFFKGLVSELTDAALACDTGYNSLPPPLEGHPVGAEAVSIQNRDELSSTKTQLQYTGGLLPGAESRSVLPGDRGYIVNDAGMKVPGGEFVVSEVTNTAFRAAVDLARRSIDSHTMAVVMASNKKCSVSTSEPDWSKLNATSVPPGYASGSVKACNFDSVTHQLIIAKGTDDGVFPDSKVYVVAGGVRMPFIADVKWVGKQSSKVQVTGMGADACKAMKNTIVAVGSCR
jgi:hypothetical protein